MRRKSSNNTTLFTVAMALLAPTWVAAGNLEPTAAPSDAASAVHTTDDLYNRLQSGAAGTKRSGPFSEPAAGPADGVGKSLDEIMAVAPAADNGNGATQAEVKTGKTFWGLRTDGAWGAQTGSASPAPVARSGQTTSYAVGDDGATQKGVASPNPRFSDSGQGTITDNLTGLVWLKNANCATVSPKTWDAALTAVAALQGDGSMCGLSDGSVAGAWRVPSVKELSSLVDFNYSSPALSNTMGTAIWSEGNPFSGVFNNFYWSSTTYAGNAAAAWYVYFTQGWVSNVNKTGPYYVWPVRGGQ